MGQRRRKSWEISSWLNEFHPDFKFRQDESYKNLNFQDIKVEVEEEEL